MKKYIYILGIKFIKLKSINVNEEKIYFFGIPLLFFQSFQNKYKINLLFFVWLSDLIHNIYNFFYSKYCSYNKRKILNSFRKGNKVNLAIQCARPGMWCFDYLYDLLIKDGRFNVVVFIMPDKLYNLTMQEYYMNKTYNELVRKGINPIKCYDFAKRRILNIRKELHPDIIFYTDFWKPHFYKDFYINKFLDKITFLNEYGFSVMQDEKTCSWELNNLVDIYFRPTQIHKDMACQLMKNKGKNVVVTGSPKLDERFDPNYKPHNIWKQQAKPKKKIIWAPHYTDQMPNNMYRNDAFWELADFMLELAKIYSNSIQFVFRPHPILKKRAIERWGVEKQESYYKEWDNLSNGQYYDGNFIDLFMTSDAMITDSCSFRAEYSSFDKPLFLTITKTSRVIHNQFGEMLSDFFYLPKDDLKDGIINFIESVVLSEKDCNAQKRHEFVAKYFSKINGKTASENIYNEILNFLLKDVKV